MIDFPWLIKRCELEQNNVIKRTNKNKIKKTTIE